MSDRPFIIRRVGDAAGEATTSDYGAHVLRWAPAGEPDVVWQPRDVFLAEGKAIRGGVPLIFPWFNSGYDEGGVKRTPKHGFARSMFWTPQESEDDTRMRWTLDSTDVDDAVLAQFYGNAAPRFHAVYEVEAGETLTCTLTVVNDGDAPFSYEAALHTYLHVGDALRASVHGLDGADFVDTALPGFPIVRQTGDVAFDGSLTDRIYLSDADVELRDPVMGRTIVLSSEGATGTVVWNPGEHDGNAIGDLREGEWRGFVCVEAVANRDRMITLAPGESHAIAQTIAVRR